nr:hypothetical protein [Bacteroidales bacterium]
ACSWQGRITGIAGALWTPSYGYRLGLAGRWLGWGKQYSGIAAGFECPTFSSTLDAAWRPDTQAFRGKATLQWEPEAAWRAVKLSPLLRLQTSWRPAERSPLRLDLRGAVSAEAAGWAFSARYDAVWGRSFAWNWYIEAGYPGTGLSCYVRGGIFKVDDWDDRIYVYERDAPGSFTVPARYGRGWNASAYGAWHINRHHSLWLRCETVQYTWNPEPKAGRVEFRLQYRYKL